MNHIFEVQCMEKRNNQPSIKKISGDEYVLLKTGEIKKFENFSKTRQENINSLRKTMKKLRYLINNNFVGAKNELFVTLTYKENMKDTERLYKDLDAFYKRFRYYYRDLTSIDYITVIEPQKRGAWHCHILFKFNDLESIYIKNLDLANIWGNGFVSIKSIDHIDNIGAYLTAYLTDMEFDDLETLVNDTDYFKMNKDLDFKEVNGKKYMKGARLYMYPAGLNIYRCSRGIKKPKRVNMTYKKAKEHIGSASPTYSGHITFENDTFSNTILYEYYNKKREGK